MFVRIYIDCVSEFTFHSLKQNFLKFQIQWTFLLCKESKPKVKMLELEEFISCGNNKTV